MQYDTNTNLSDVSPKDSRWDDLKSRADDTAYAYRVAGNHDYATRITHCASNLWMKVEPDSSTGEIVLKLYNAKFCRTPYCPICQSRKSFKYIAKTIQMLPDFMKEYNTRFIFLTLSNRNCEIERVGETVEDINYAFRKMKQWKKYPGLGTVKAIEIKKSKDGKANIHIHSIVAVKPSYFGKGYIKQSEWISMWRKALRVDYDPHVDIRAIDKNTMENAIRYLVKYSTKADDVRDDPEWLSILEAQTKNKRFFDVSGIFKPFFKKVDKYSEDYIGSDEEENTSIESIVFGWNRNNARYTKVD